MHVSGPKRKQIGQVIKIPMTGPHSIRRAINEARPSAKTVGDLIKPAPLPPRRSRMAVWAKTCMEMMGGKKQRIQINPGVGKQTAFSAFLGLVQILQMQSEYAFNSIV